MAYISYIPFIWRRIKIRGLKIAGLHTHLLLPHQHLVETMLHPFKAGLEWYLKAIGFFIGLPLIKIDLMSFDAIHTPGCNFDSIENNKIYEIPLWIDIDKIPQIDEKFQTFTVLFTGRKTWEKGWSTFCKVVSELKRMNHDFQFLCTGEGRNGIEGLGFLDENELLCVYKRSHVVVYPSIADIFGLVILEAASCGTPIITTPIDAHSRQHLPVLYARSTDNFTKAILSIHTLWTEHPKMYDDWCNKLQTSATSFDVKRIFPQFEKMLENVNKQLHF